MNTSFTVNSLQQCCVSLYITHPQYIIYLYLVLPSYCSRIQDDFGDNNNKQQQLFHRNRIWYSDGGHCCIKYRNIEHNIYFYPFFAEL